MTEVKLKKTYKKIPDIISWICQHRLQNSNKTYHRIWEFIQADQFLGIVFPRIFEQEHKDNDLKLQMSSYGLKGVRDRLASLYLQHLSEGKWPKEVDISYILEVQQFEERFFEFSNEWDSRIFMLGFYLRTVDIEKEKNNDLEDFEINLPLEVDEILVKGKPKIEKLDWLIIVIKEVLKFISKDEVIKWLTSDSTDFFDLFFKLNKDSQKEVLKNCLMYGNAIGDREFFVFNKV